jgi:hypothetical protein
MLVRVFEMPTFSGGFRFGAGKPETFIEVDWFRDDGPPTPDFGTAAGRGEVEQFIRGKVYFKPSRAYLVLHPEHPFTIGYNAP